MQGEAPTSKLDSINGFSDDYLLPATSSQPLQLGDDGAATLSPTSVIPKRLVHTPSKSILKSPKPEDNPRTTSAEEYRRNISWQDFHGKELTQVVEFEPSEHPDSDYDDLEERACCAIQ